MVDWQSNTVGAFDSNLCVGIIIHYPTLSWILNLTMARDHRRKGIASALAAALWDHADSKRQAHNDLGAKIQ